MQRHSTDNVATLTMRHQVQHSPLRWPLAAAALASAAAHVPVIPQHLREAPYMGVLFILLSIACTVLAAVAVFYDTAEVYVLSALVCCAAVLGYAATRVVAFPQLADDVGHWLDPYGVAAITAESVVVTLAVIALRRSRTPRRDHRVLMTR